MGFLDRIRGVRGEEMTVAADSEMLICAPSQAPPEDQGSNLDVYPMPDDMAVVVAESVQPFYERGRD